MASFRGIDQKEIVKSLNALFDFLRDQHIGPLTEHAIVTWQAPGGLLDKIAAAKSAKEIDFILRNEGNNNNDHTNFAFWMDCYFDGLLPQIQDAYSRQTDGLYKSMKVQGVVEDVYAWGGFRLSAGRFHIMYPEDNEIKKYCENTLGGYDPFLRYSDEAFKGPFVEYTVVYSAKVDFYQAAEALKDLTEKLDMRDHVDGFYPESGRVILKATPSFADRVIEEAADKIEDKDAVPAGLAQGSSLRLIKSPKPN